MEELSDERLIVHVQQYKHLYDLQDANYHNNVMRDNSWEEIGALFNTQGNKTQYQV